MDIKCEFCYIGNRYYCFIKKQEIPTNGPRTFSGKHKDGYENMDVNEVYFDYCNMLNIPQGLKKTFPNLEALTIKGLNLKSLRKKDLAEYKLLNRIDIWSNLIEFLPGDLFEGFKNLERFSFFANNLKIIEPNILDGLNNLKFVNFHHNQNYDMFYSDDESDYTLKNLKNDLNQVFLKNFVAYKDIMRKDFEHESELQKIVENQEDHPKPQNGIFSDIKNFIDDEKFKDFKIQVDDREFHVHKFLLTARSPTFADIILNNPEVENLNLVDIPVDIFEIILKFLYTDELPPVEDLNDLRVFAAAGRLKIAELKNFAATHAMNQINGDNALEVLNLSNKYEHVELRQKSFGEIKKEYPKIMFKDKHAMEPEFVEIIIEKFKKKEELIRKLDDEFQNELMSD